MKLFLLLLCQCDKFLAEKNEKLPRNGQKFVILTWNFYQIFVTEQIMCTFDDLDLV